MDFVLFHCSFDVTVVSTASGSCSLLQLTALAGLGSPELELVDCDKDTSNSDGRANELDSLYWFNTQWLQYRVEQNP